MRQDQKADSVIVERKVFCFVSNRREDLILGMRCYEILIQQQQTSGAEPNHAARSARRAVTCPRSRSLPSGQSPQTIQSFA